MSEISDDHATIIALTQSETAAFLARDFPRWADHWLHDPAIRRLASFMGGMMDWQEGWEAGESSKEALMNAVPNLYNTDLSSYRFENYSIRISSDMAWVSYDQYGPRSDDPLVTAGLSYQIRIFERHDGQWKIVMAGHGDTNIEYFDFPAIRVDDSAAILWMNDEARTAISNHPVLTKSGAHLRCHNRGDDKTLRAALIDCAGMNVIDRRPSLTEPRNRPDRPYVLKGKDGVGQHIIWVSHRDGMLLVTFDNEHAKAAQLDQAQQLFNLSPAQARLAGLVLTGVDLPQAAEQLGVTLNTVKTHLQRLFDKTDARSQLALISKLLGVAPPG